MDAFCEWGNSHSMRDVWGIPSPFIFNASQCERGCDIHAVRMVPRFAE
jgi:hypothetical protein